VGRPYAEVIGDPVAHSKSPLIHNFWLAKLGIDAGYRACHVRPDELADYFARRRGDADWRGCNVTIPHKVAALEYVDKTVQAASEIGALNCVVKNRDALIGSNTDIDGVEAAIGKWDWDWAPICVIGNGGAARSALWYIANGRMDRFAGRYHKHDIRLLARDTAKSKRLLEEFGIEGRCFKFADADDALVGAALIINATSLGMTGQLDMPESVLGGLSKAYADALLLDMVYSPLETNLLRRAADAYRGKDGQITIRDGLAMLIGQADRAFQWFFGAQAPRAHDAELRALLTA
jgi:shikimate dehydrogenase